MKITIKNIDKTFSVLNKQLDKRVEDNFILQTQAMVSELKKETPIDTGLARNSWNINYDSKDKAIISNDVNYLEYLNEGSSKQAPARFIESVAINYGKPLGNIVDIKK